MDKPGEPVIELIRSMRRRVEQILEGGAAVRVELDQQVAEVKGVTLFCSRVVRSWWLAVFTRTLPSESKLMQCISDRGERVGQVPGETK